MILCIYNKQWENCTADYGQYYNELNRSYVIFICPFDAFGKGRHIYTFENICKEDGSISMGDEAVKIFLNAKGTMDDVSKELKAFLDYTVGRKSDDVFIRKLEEAVEEAKRNREWRHEYMTLLMRDQENMEKGMEKGKIEGRAEEIIESGFEFGLSEKDILTRLQNKLHISLQAAQQYLLRFGKQMV